MTTQKDTMPDEIYMLPIVHDGQDVLARVMERDRFGHTVVYTRSDLVQAKDAEIAKLKQERDLLAREFVDYLDNGNAPATNGYMEALRIARKIVREG